MKKIHASKDAIETARQLCDEVEAGMTVRTGVKAGSSPGYGPGNNPGRGKAVGNPHEPEIIALYGVVISS